MIALFLAAALPVVLWDKGPETVDALRAASIPCIATSAEAAKAWSGTGYCVKPVAVDQLEKLPPPGTKWGVRGIGTASATRAPWVNSNAWRFLRKPDGKYLYEVPKGEAPLAAAEAFMFNANAWLKVLPEDLKPAGAMLEFLKGFSDDAGFEPATNIAVLDNNSRALPEALNLLARRNLLFRVVSKPDPKADLNIEIGSKDFPEAEAMDPTVFANKARQKLTDKKRLVRVYGAEVVLVRLYRGPKGARLHILNYGSDKAEAVQIRVQGAYNDPRIAAFGYSDAKLSDVVQQSDAVEFNIPEMGVYAIVDLKAR